MKGDAGRCVSISISGLNTSYSENDNDIGLPIAKLAEFGR